MRNRALYLIGIPMVLTAFIAISYPESDVPEAIVFSPANGAADVNPDTRLKLVFPKPPVAGKSGQVRIYDAADNRLVDVLDMSIPAGPTAPTPSPDATYTPVPYEYVSGNFTNADTKAGTPSGKALATSDEYQLTIIGGFTDAFHFYPVIVNENTATIYPHNNLLEYGRAYYVEIDPGVVTVGGGEFPGVAGENGWRFTTKKKPPSLDVARLTVSADGTGDFDTVQGAVDFIPESHPNRITVFVRSGMYEEIVYFRNKTDITILGEDRDKTVVYYQNSEIFNPHPVNIKTNEVPGTFPSRRAAFAADHSSGVHLVNLTIRNTAYGQAEGLLLNGEKFIVSHVTIVGSGDALQSNGTAYYADSRIVGDGDTILGRGPAFFRDCELNSYGPYMWIRNTEANHGNVFVNCIFKTRGNRETVLARSPANGGKNYPYTEAVLIDCLLSGIDPVGWGDIGGDASNVRYWEYNSRNLDDGKPVDASRRHPASRRLEMDSDAERIASYRDPAWVLSGWNPEMAPLVLAQPESSTATFGQTVAFHVEVAAVPPPSYRWFKNGVLIPDAKESSLTVKNARSSDAARYTVEVENYSGRTVSDIAVLTISR